MQNWLLRRSGMPWFSHLALLNFTPEPSQDRSRDFDASTGSFVPFTIIDPCFNNAGDTNCELTTIINYELPPI